MNIESFIILCVVSFFAALLRGAIGMGFALMVLPFYLLFGVGLVPTVVIMLGLLLSILTVARDWRSMDTSGLKFSLSGRFLGNIVAIMFFSYLTDQIFDTVISIMVMIAVIVSLLPHRLKITPSKLVGAGFVSGVMGTISSLDGPPIALLYQHQKGDRIRSTLGGFFIVGGVLSLAVLAIAGNVGIYDLKWFLYLSIPTILGFLLSKKLIGVLPEKMMRVGILSISSLSAVLILWKSVS